MANNNGQNQLNREVDENGLDLTLRLGVGNSRIQTNPLQNQANSGLGFGMMAGENSNPLPNVGSGSNGSTIGSSSTVPVIGLNINQASHGDSVPLSNIPEFLRFPNNGNNINNVNNNNNNHHNMEVHFAVDIEMPVQPPNNIIDLTDDNMEDSEPENFELAFENSDDYWDYAEYTDDDEVASDEIMDGIEFVNGNLTYEEMLRIQAMIGNVDTGLSERTIDEMLVRYIYPIYNFGATKCCICQEDFAHGEMIGFLECMHDDFHYRCIKKWLVRKNECPLCKAVAIPVDD